MPRKRKKLAVQGKMLAVQRRAGKRGGGRRGGGGREGRRRRIHQIRTQKRGRRGK